MVPSLADALLARHAIFPPKRDGEERLRDEPKERLRGRLDSWRRRPFSRLIRDVHESTEESPALFVPLLDGNVTRE